MNNQCYFLTSVLWKIPFFFKLLLFSHLKHVVGVTARSQHAKQRPRAGCNWVSALGACFAVSICVSVAAATLFQLENNSLIINVDRHLMCLPRFHLTAYWLCIPNNAGEWAPLASGEEVMNECMKHCFHRAACVRRVFGRYQLNKK